jgi:hypothetical protein
MTKLLALIAAFSFFFTCTCQETPKTPQTKFLLKLLPPYRLELRTGFEANENGRIWADKQLQIDFAVGMYFGSDADRVNPKEVLWRREQLINGKTMICVFTTSHELVVSFPRDQANFRAKIQNEQALADMLLMVATYNPEGYPVDPSLLTLHERNPSK